MGVSGTARETLQTVQSLGGQASCRAISRRLGIEPGHAGLVCLALASKDYLDLKDSGLFAVTPKGEQALCGDSSPSAPPCAKPNHVRQQPCKELGGSLPSCKSKRLSEGE